MPSKIQYIETRNKHENCSHLYTGENESYYDMLSSVDYIIFLDIKQLMCVCVYLYSNFFYEIRKGFPSFC